jgi:hypothetical protein
MEGPFIVATVAIVFGISYAAFEEWNKTRRAQLERGGSADAERIADLEQRVRTLERIVTDKGYELEQEFRRLERSA